MAGSGSKKRGKKKDAGPPPKRPRNTVTLWLDGDDSTVINDFLSCQAHYQYYLLCNSGFRARYGDNLIYTTPLDGTFYYVIRYKGRYVVFVIMARTAWLIGFCTDKGFFQVQSDEIQGKYMDSDNTKVLHFNGNHKAISPNGTSSAMVNLDATRRHFDGLCDYNGPTNRQDPHGFSSHTGYFVVFLMESKCKLTCKRHCDAFTGYLDFNPEDDWVTDAITNWSSISQQTMRSLDDSNHKPTDCGIRALKLLDQLIDVFYYLHVDGYFSGLFDHAPMEPAPRKLTWDPVDMGIGDGDIVVLKEPDVAESINSRGARKRGFVDKSMSIQERRSKKPKGLCGGGLGGPPEAPDVFRQWADGAIDDSVMQKKKCDDLISHLNLLGLDVPQAKRKPGKWELTPSGKRHKGNADLEETKDKLAEQLRKDVDKCRLDVTEKPAPTSITSGTGHSKFVEGSHIRESISSSTSLDSSKPKFLLDSNDTASLAGDGCVDDPVINWVFKDLMSNLEHNGIHDVLLMDPILSYLLSFAPDGSDGTIADLKISSKQLVLLPVNNNRNPDRSAAGTHWSLIVYDHWTQYGPRLLHYDSAGGSNFNIASGLAKNMQRHLPKGTADLEPMKTPQQGFDNNCAFFVVEIARIICDWCMHAAAGSQEDDWSATLFREIDSKKIAKFRIQLHERAQRESKKTPP